jgi:hypothetical protein
LCDNPKPEDAKCCGESEGISESKAREQKVMDIVAKALARAKRKEKQ